MGAAFEALSYPGGDIQKGALLGSAASLMMMIMMMMHIHCQEPIPEIEEEADQNEIERVKANDPLALFNMGNKFYLR